jgi:hypothetical protein
VLQVQPPGAGVAPPPRARVRPLIWTWCWPPSLPDSVSVACSLRSGAAGAVPVILRLAQPAAVRVSGSVGLASLGAPSPLTCAAPSTRSRQPRLQTLTVAL